MPTRVFFPTNPVDSISTPLSTTERERLRHFEHHARNCASCNSPYERYRDGAPLCRDGRSKARAVSELHLYSRSNGDIVRRSSRNSRQKHLVEMPGKYCHSRDLLKALRQSRGEWLDQSAGYAGYADPPYRERYAGYAHSPCRDNDIKASHRGKSQGSQYGKQDRRHSTSAYGRGSLESLDYEYDRMMSKREKEYDYAYPSYDTYRSPAYDTLYARKSYY